MRSSDGGESHTTPSSASIMPSVARRAPPCDWAQERQSNVRTSLIRFEESIVGHDKHECVWRELPKPFAQGCCGPRQFCKGFPIGVIDQCGPVQYGISRLDMKSTLLASYYYTLDAPRSHQRPRRTLLPCHPDSRAVPGWQLRPISSANLACISTPI